jgi:hypothetical protein
VPSAPQQPSAQQSRVLPPNQMLSSSRPPMPNPYVANQALIRYEVLSAEQMSLRNEEVN